MTGISVGHRPAGRASADTLSLTGRGHHNKRILDSSGGCRPGAEKFLCGTGTGPNPRHQIHLGSHQSHPAVKSKRPSPKGQKHRNGRNIRQQSQWQGRSTKGLYAEWAPATTRAHQKCPRIAPVPPSYMRCCPQKEEVRLAPWGAGRAPIPTQSATESLTRSPHIRKATSARIECAAVRRRW